MKYLVAELLRKNIELNPLVFFLQFFVPKPQVSLCFQTLFENGLVSLCYYLYYVIFLHLFFLRLTFPVPIRSRTKN